MLKTKTRAAKSGAATPVFPEAATIRGRSRVSNGGRIVLPVEMRRLMGIEIGEEVLLCLDQGKIQIQTRKRALRELQDLVARHVSPGRSLVRELIAERRAEAARE